MPKLWFRVIESVDRDEVRIYWLDILNRYINKMMLVYTNICITNETADLNNFMKLCVAPFTFNNGDFDYVIPDPVNEPMDSQLKAENYILNNHQLYNPAIAIRLADCTVIGGVIPCNCFKKKCINHRKLTTNMYNIS